MQTELWLRPKYFLKKKKNQQGHLSAGLKQQEVSFEKWDAPPPAKYCSNKPQT